ncbi:MAG TPA: glutamate racemase [Gemmatimonadaceae bacterium]|nr:glutamate racemase [Gemmatimonadaceae bacterium]
MVNEAQPIGVFDSGIGGLTVAREIMRQLPNESIIYFGDTARVPYGPKSPETVLRYSREITAFLKDQGVKAVVVACNTATAHALHALREENDLPIIGVIEPGSRAAARATKTGNIGVIGTQGTINSHAYERCIEEQLPTAHITARACPLFVPLVEEGWLETDATNIIAREYLGSFVDANVDTLVLGCTHYPLLKRAIGEVVGRSVRLIDSAEETAAETGATLKEAGLARTNGNEPPTYRFIASDVPDQFLRVGQRFLGSAIDHVETVTLG